MRKLRRFTLAASLALLTTLALPPKAEARQCFSVNDRGEETLSFDRIVDGDVVFASPWESRITTKFYYPRRDIVATGLIEDAIRRAAKVARRPIVITAERSDAQVLFEYTDTSKFAPSKDWLRTIATYTSDDAETDRIIAKVRDDRKSFHAWFKFDLPTDKKIDPGATDKVIAAEAERLVQQSPLERILFNLDLSKSYNADAAVLFALIGFYGNVVLQSCDDYIGVLAGDTATKTFSPHDIAFIRAFSVDHLDE